MALTMNKGPKRQWKSPLVTTTAIEVPVVLTLCSGFLGVCSVGSTCCNNPGGGCGFGGTCVPR